MTEILLETFSTADTIYCVKRNEERMRFCLDIGICIELHVAYVIRIKERNKRIYKR